MSGAAGPTITLHTALLVLLSASIAAPALAAPPAAPESPSTHAPAADHIARADAARRADRWADAAAAYEAALAAPDQASLPEARRAGILGELGLSELALGRHRDAAEHLHLALQHRGALRLEQQRRFEAGQKNAEREIAMLFISADPPDAEVLVDGRSIGARRQSYIVFVEPGSHIVRARLAGHAEGVTTADAPRGRSSSVWLRLKEIPPEPPPPLPTVAADPGGPRSDTAGKLRVAGVVVASVGVALGVSLAIAGEAVDGEAESLSSALGPHGCVGSAPAPACADLHDTLGMRDSLDRASLASFIASGAVGLATLSSLWWAPSGPAVVPAVTDKQAGFILRTTW